MPTPCVNAPVAAPDPTLDADVHAAFDRRLDVGSRAPIALALSGGGDSMALLALAAAWADRHHRPVLALTVDHGLNPDSRAWSALAAKAATRAGAGWLGLEWRGEKPTSGLPAAARAARHALMADAARAAGAKVLLTGHTLSDVEEGERMRQHDAPGLGRLREWSPSPAWPQGRGLFLLRPLLGVRREALRDWLRARGETWIEDPGNEDTRFARTRARFQASRAAEEEGPRDIGAPGRRAPSSLSPSAGPLPLPQAERERCTLDGRVLLPRSGIDAPLLSAALLCAAGTGQPPRGVQIERLLERLAGPAPVDATLAGARLVADADSIQVGRDAGERFRGGLAPLTLPEGLAVVWDGRFEIVAEADGFAVHPLGEVIARLGAADRARIKTVPAWARGALPALVSPDKTVSLPRPLGAGQAAATTLAGPRLSAAIGLSTRESDVGYPPHGADGLVTLC